MKQEDKELLLKDLCSRLPYGVVVELDEKFGFNKGIHSLVKELLDPYGVEGIKPYLRPMSSMTEEEENEYYNIEFGFNIHSDRVDWLNAHHFDYRGLIEKGLAIDVTEDNNPYKT
jgi:hypothetical protein